MKIRPKFNCWNEKCRREYTLYREVDQGLRLFVECPYCGTEAEVDLAPYRSPAMEIYKSSDKPELKLEMFNFPEVLPTSPPAAAN
jgi:hypothetical protein